MPMSDYEIRARRHHGDDRDDEDLGSDSEDDHPIFRGGCSSQHETTEGIAP